MGPSGARAASAGFILLMAADVAAMAPATHAGAAHPVSGSGEKMDDTTSQKAASDAAAYVRTLANSWTQRSSRRRSGPAESRFHRSRSTGRRTATHRSERQGCGRCPDATRRAHDQAFDGRSTTVHTRDAEVRRVDLTRRQRFLSAIAHPQVSYILMTLGLLGLTVELWNPGLIAPGVIGGCVCCWLSSRFNTCRSTWRDCFWSSLASRCSFSS